MKCFQELSTQQQMACILRKIALLDRISNQKWQQSQKGVQSFEKRKS